MTRASRALDAVHELNASDLLPTEVELLDSEGDRFWIIVYVATVADIVPTAEAWADAHGHPDHAANDWRAA